MKSVMFNNFVVNYDDKGRMCDFEAVKGAQIHDVVRDIIRYLQLRKINGEYILIFNEIELKISRFSSSIEVVRQYFDSCETNV